MELLVGGSRNGRKFPYDSKKYEGNEFSIGEVITGDKTVYVRYELNEHTFWVDQNLSEEEIEERIQHLLKPE
ncbi:hypothetical protein WH285_13845 [Acinetobacter johnsonii]|uniref:hypothetical protein n=1 Tax=Acinetobacter johnsonii TaxID=40214 RepID=UPI0030A2FE59